MWNQVKFVLMAGLILSAFIAGPAAANRRIVLSGGPWGNGSCQPAQGEQWDDGNSNNGDGWDSSWQREAGWNWDCSSGNSIWYIWSCVGSENWFLMARNAGLLKVTANCCLLLI